MVEAFITENYVSPLYDFVFTEIFGTQKNIDITMAFLKTFLDIPEDDYERLTVVNPALRRIFRNEKSGVVDLKLTTKSGRIIHVELQVENRSNLKNRIIYYAARLIGDQLKWGEDYNKLHQVISIIICNHILLEEEKSYINEFQLRNKNNNSFTKLLKIVILELPKVPENEDSAVWPWLQFFKCKEKEDFNMLALKYPELKKPVSCAKKMSLTELWRDYWFHKNLYKWDEVNRIRQIKIDARAEGLAEGKAEGLVEGKAEGRAEGRAEGHAEGKLEIARNLITKGSTLEFVQEVTGISDDEIKKLQNQG